MLEWQNFGKHYYRRERDLLILEMHGDIHLTEMQQLLSLLKDMISTHGYCLVLGDIRGGFSIDKESRRMALDGFLKEHAKHYANAIIGASPLARGVVALVMGASRVLFGQANYIQFFATDTEGRAWLDTQRVRFGKK
jgi:hypothetical protein